MKIHTPTLENKINTHLSSIPDDKRPEASTRERIQSVAIATTDFFEATDTRGHTEMVKRDTAAGWLRL